METSWIRLFFIPFNPFPEQLQARNIGQSFRVLTLNNKSRQVRTRPVPVRFRRNLEALHMIPRESNWSTGNEGMEKSSRHEEKKVRITLSALRDFGDTSAF